MQKIKTRKIEKKLQAIIAAEEGPRQPQLYAVQLQKLLTVISAAAESDAPGEELYRRDGRTPLFMLEGLARLHERTNDRKTFRHWRAVFKELEDALGLVDYCDHYATLTRRHNFDRRISEFFDQKMRQALGEMERRIEKARWLLRKKEACTFPLFLEMADTLGAVSWPKPKKERRVIIAFLVRKLSDITRSVEKQRYDFNNLEGGIHEFRRNIRWFSIYAHALGGLIGFRQEAKPDPLLAKYCTSEVSAAPFNRLPSFSGSGRPILIAPSSFQALSWVIQELGTLKDAAQFREAIREGLREIEPTPGPLHQASCAIVDGLVESDETIRRSVQRLIEEYVLERRGIDRLGAEFEANL